jgi:hypothetical protein
MRLATIKFASRVPYAKVSGFPIPERGTEKQILFGGTETRVLSGLFDKVTASFPVWDKKDLTDELNVDVPIEA